jgi:hypothetical protein
MATNNFAPKVWAATILRTLEDNLVARKICNTKYTGAIKKAGDAVYFNGMADPTISAYTGATITYEALQDSRITLLVDQADMFAFKVGDIEDAQAEMDVKGSQAQRAAYGLKKACDTYIMGLYTGAGKTATTATVTSANVLSVLGNYAQLLMESNVDESDMWMVIPPWFKIKMELAGIKFQVNNGLNGKGSMAWSDQLGFDIYVSNQVVNTGTVATPVSQIMAGSGMAIAFADQINETETLRAIDTFDDLVRGLHNYGAKIVKPLELVSGAMTFGSESTI